MRRSVVDAERVHSELCTQGRRRREPHRHPRDSAGILDTEDAEDTVSAYRHRAQTVGEHEAETARSCGFDVEVMC